MIFMRLQCREIATGTRRRREFAVTELLRHARIVTDPNHLAYLKGEAAKRKVRTESDLRASRLQL
jgi:hypothetical protein